MHAGVVLRRSGTQSLGTLVGLRAMVDPGSQAEPRHIHLDVVGGIAGDMFIATLLDAYPDLIEGTVAAVRSAGVPDDWTVGLESADEGLVGSRMRIDPPRDVESDHHDYASIESSIHAAALEPRVRDRALDILRLIADAEAEIHGMTVENVVLHEVGAIDSVADVVGAAYLIEELSPATWSISALPVGGGFVDTDHGRLPVPAPATQLLLNGFPFVDDGIGGERITPTGAAILRYLEPSFRLPDGVFHSAETGHGFGTRELPGVANVLRARGYVAAHRASSDEQVAVIEFMVDDQTPEDLAVGLDILRDQSGVLEVLQTAVVAKKGRMGFSILVLAEPASLEQTVQACFEQTTTIGLRYRYEERMVLPRTELSGVADVSLKVVDRPGGGETAKAEMDDVARHADRHDDRQRLRRRVEAAALQEVEHEQQ